MIDDNLSLLLCYKYSEKSEKSKVLSVSGFLQSSDGCGFERGREKRGKLGRMTAEIKLGGGNLEIAENS